MTSLHILGGQFILNWMILFISCHFHINKGIQKIEYGMHFSSVECVKGEQKKTSYILSLPATPSMNCADEHTWDIEHFWITLHYELDSFSFPFIILEFFVSSILCLCDNSLRITKLWKKVLKKNWSCLSIGIGGRRSC